MHQFIKYPRSHFLLVFAAEAGLFKVSDGDQHSPHRPVAHHWRHAEWLWGIQPEVWLRGRPRLFPRLDTPLLPAEGQGQRVHINTHTLRSDNLLPSLPTKQKKKPVFFFCCQEDPLKSGEEERALRPCHGSADQGNLLLALVGPESHDFNVVMGVTSGKGHLMPWRTVAHFQQQREDPLTPSPILPCPSPPTTPPSLDAPGAALNTTTEVLLCRITKHSRCYKKCFLIKTVIIIIILYNIVPFRIHSKNLHVPQLI